LALVASYIYINLQIGTLLLRASNVLVRGHWNFDHSPDQENSRTSSDTQEFEKGGFDIETVLRNISVEGAIGVPRVQQTSLASVIITVATTSGQSFIDHIRLPHQVSRLTCLRVTSNLKAGSSSKGPSHYDRL
jgi:hypothetical protein